MTRSLEEKKHNQANSADAKKQRGWALTLEPNKIMISEQSKDTIDSLSFDELREEVLKDSSRFQGEKFDYLLARFSKLKDEQRAAEHRENVEIQGEHLKSAEEANRIAEKANGLSKIAIWVSVLAFIIALFTFANTMSNDSSNTYEP